MKITFENKVSISEFDNIADLIKYVTTTPLNKVYAGMADSKLTSNFGGKAGKEFTGTNSFDEAIAMLKNGWDDMAKTIEGKLALVTSKQVTKTSPRPTYSMAGYQACVPRYLQGVPESMIYSKRVPVKQKVITINKQSNYRSDISIEKIIDESIKALTIVTHLEAQGYRVNLNAVTCSDGSDGYTHITKTCIKKASERISVSKMAFPLCNPSFQRRIVFRHIEVCPTTSHSFRWGYGSTNYHANKFFEDKSSGVYYIPPFVGDVDKFITNMQLK